MTKQARPSMRKTNGPEASPFDTLAQFSTDIICVLRGNGELINANPAFSTILGYQIEQAGTLSLFDLLHPDDRIITEEMFTSARETGVIKELEHRCQCKQGSYRWLEWRATYDADSGYLYGIARDITARKLEEERGRLNSAPAIEKAIFPVCCVDRQGFNLYANDTSCRSLGYTFEEMLTLSIFDYLPTITGSQWRQILEQLDSGESTRFEAESRRADGLGIPVEITLTSGSPKNRYHIYVYLHDISHIKKTEKDLLFSRFAMDSAGDGVYLFDSHGEILYANEAAGKQLGYSVDELITMSVRDLNPDLAKHDYDEDEKWRAIADGDYHTFEVVHRRKDGTHIPVEIVVNIMEYEGKEYSCAFARDITNRKESERQLKILNFAVDKAVDAVYLSDNKGNIQYVNNSACRTLGYDIEELVAMNITDLDPNTSREALAGNIERGRRGEFNIIQSIHLRKDGLGVPVEVTAKLMTFEDTDYIVSFVRDITERKRAAKKMEELQFAVDNAIDAVYLSDRYAKIYYVNESACRQLGYSREELISMSIFDIDPTTPQNSVNELWQQGWDGQISTFESLHQKKDGTSFPVEISSSVTDFEGSQFACAFVRDITDRKQHQIELQVYREQLEELVESRTAALVDAQQQLVRKERLAALGQLTGVVSHELRNPLGVIRTSLFMLRRMSTDSSDVMSRTLERAENNIIRCDVIIDELLDYTRTAPLNLQSIRIDEWLKEIINEYSFPPDVSVESHLDTGMDVDIEPERFRRCMFNLLSNACEAMLENPNGRPKHLQITSRIEDGDLIIDIEDSGPGIPEDQMKTVFEPLFSTKNFGVGLGLPIVDQIVKQHNGSIALASTIGKGTKFSLTLPISKSMDAERG